MEQVTKKQVRKLTLNDMIVSDVIPTTVQIKDTLANGIKIASIDVNGNNKVIYAPNHQDISYKLDRSEFLNVSATFLTSKDLKPYAKTENLPTRLSEFINDSGYTLCSDVINVSSDLYNKFELSTKNVITVINEKTTSLSHDLSSYTNEKINIVSNELCIIFDSKIQSIKNTYALSSDIDNKLIDYAKNTDLPGIADNGIQGTIALGYQESGKNYPVQLDNGKAYVYVPWTGGSAADVAVDGTTIKKKLDGTNQIYVDQDNLTKKVSTLENQTFNLNDYTLGEYLTLLTNKMGGTVN